MEETRANRVVDQLRARGVDARVKRASTYQFGVSVPLPDGREAEWDTDGSIGLEAQVMRNGVLVGFVPQLEGSEEFSLEQVVEAIVQTDYDLPIATRRREPVAPGPALPLEGGVFRRMLGGFRD